MPKSIVLWRRLHRFTQALTRDINMMRQATLVSLCFSQSLHLHVATSLVVMVRSSYIPTHCLLFCFLTIRQYQQSRLIGTILKRNATLCAILSAPPIKTMWSLLTINPTSCLSKSWDRCSSAVTPNVVSPSISPTLISLQRIKSMDQQVNFYSPTLKYAAVLWTPPNSFHFA